MKPSERVITAINLEEPDRVPHFEMGICSEVLTEIYKKDIALFDSLHKRIEAYVNLGLDGAFIEFGDMGYGVPYKILNRELFVDGWGNIFSKSMTSYSAFKGAYYVGGYLNTPEKYFEFHQKYPLPDVEEWRIKSIPAYKKIVKKYEDEIFIVPVVGGILEPNITPIGYTFFFKYVYENPSFIEKILYDTKRRTIEILKIFIEEGADIVALEDDYGEKHGPIMSPRHWLRFVFPHLKEIVDMCHKRGVFLMLHSDGNIEPLIKYLIEAGVDALQSLEPTADMNLQRIKEEHGNKICLVGGIDLNILGLGTTNEVMMHVKDRINAAAPGGGYMLGATHGIYPLTNDIRKLSINFLTLVMTLQKYGRYNKCALQ